MSEVMERLRGSLAGIRAQIAEARERRASGDPAARKRVVALREEEEIAADRLALLEAEEAERRQAAEEAARVAAAARRKAEVAAMVDRHEALVRDVLAKAVELREAMTALVENGKTIQRTEGMDSYWLNGVMIRAGLAVATVWPYAPALLGAKARHGWEAGWPAEERMNLTERLGAG